MSNVTEQEIQDQIRLTELSSSFPSNGTIGKYLRGDSLGGKATDDIAKEMERQSKFLKNISSISYDDLNKVTDEDGNDYVTAVQDIDGIQYSFFINLTEVVKNLQAVEVNDKDIEKIAKKYNIETKQTYINIGDKKYNVTMNIPLYFNRGDEPNFIIHFAANILGDTALSAALASIISLGIGKTFSEAFSKLSRTLFQRIFQVLLSPIKFSFRLITSFFLRLCAGDSFLVAITTAWGRGVAVFTEIGWGGFATGIGGIILLALVFVIVELVLHTSYQVVYVYNLTKYDLKLKIPYIDWGKITTPIDTTNQIIIEGAHERKTGAISLGVTYNGTALGFSSDSELHGLGYTIQALLIDKENNEQVDELACLFDIPFAGKNSLYASFESPQNGYENFYKIHNGTKKELQYSTKSLNKPNIEAIMTYNALSGKQKDPQTGKEIYLYTSLLIIRDLV